MCTQWGFGFLLQNIWVPGQRHGRNLECLINRQQENLFKTTLISSNHVNNAVGVFTCHKPKAFVCVSIKLVYHCIQWKLNVSVYMPVAMPSLVVFPVPLWRVDMSLHVFKKAERSFGCCCQNTIDIRIQVIAYKYQCLTKIVWIYLVCGV
jgi:hypothetical protein